MPRGNGPESKGFWLSKACAKMFVDLWVPPKQIAYDEL